LADILESFEPYGEGNERPIFTAKNKLVKEIKPIGKEKGFRLTLCDKSGYEQKTVKAVCFRGNAKPKEGEYVDFRFSVYKNSFFGGSVELMVEEILLS
jgi:single-stranded-DNA-specific exonuclease